MKAVSVLLFLALTSGITASVQARTFTGVISESMCKASHAGMKISPDATCVTECVRTAKNVVYVLIVGKDAYTLSDQKAPAQFAARKVNVKGVLNAKTRVIAVESIQAVD